MSHILRLRQRHVGKRSLLRRLHAAHESEAPGIITVGGLRKDSLLLVLLSLSLLLLLSLLRVAVRGVGVRIRVSESHSHDGAGVAVYLQHAHWGTGCTHGTDRALL